jgi:hypothetical protein
LGAFQWNVLEETVVIENHQLVSSYGTLWARNESNIKALRARGKLFGVYVLCDGSMPVYIGRGKLSGRLAQHRRSKRRGQFWDHFSWFAIPDRRLEGEIEALLLIMLPFYLRSLNRQRARFAGGVRVKQVSHKADFIERPEFAAKRMRR